MIEFGIYLRTARENAGLTLTDLHDRTRISLKNLRLIESGDFPSIPQTYVRAFVREYARTVGLDEDEIITRYNEEAEREKGIPPPPVAFDSSNLLPKVDDTVEFVLPSDHPPSHVEVVGTAEVETEDFIVPIRKSSYIQESDAAAIDIRTSSASEYEKPPQRKETPPKATAEKPQPSTIPETRVTNPKTAAEEAPPPKIAKPAAAPAKVPLPKAEQPRSEAAPADGAPPPPPPARMPGDSASEKRIIGIGLVVVIMLAIAVYGIYYFSSGSGDDLDAVDSTSIKASIEAGRFIDSSQYALTELDPAADDTAAEVVTPPDPGEAKQRVFSREDSLVLEAFTSAPVWFSVKMDTLRTERGSLSSNEHRIWKARDYFVITLGDAGAVTFFLNGREIGTLGEEGAVVKNLTLSRQNLNGN